MNRTIAGVFDTPSRASQAVQELINNGVRRDDISVVTLHKHTDGTLGETATVDDGSNAGQGAGVGAVSGGVLGGTLGLLVGIGALAIPGIGPVLAAGPLAAALGSAGAGALVGAGVGAASGGLLGALVGAGIPEQDAHVYAESLRRGSTLVTVSTSEQSEAMVNNVLRSQGAMDMDIHSAQWRQEGWDGTASYGGSPVREWEQSSKIGAATGTAAGAATGAAAGSVAGPVGTIVGGAAGAVVGAGVGAAGDVAGKRADEDLDDEYVDEDLEANVPAQRDNPRKTTY